MAGKMGVAQSAEPEGVAVAAGEQGGESGPAVSVSHHSLHLNKR